MGTCGFHFAMFQKMTFEAVPFSCLAQCHQHWSHVTKFSLKGRFEKQVWIGVEYMAQDRCVSGHFRLRGRSMSLWKRKSCHDAGSLFFSQGLA